MNPATLPPNWTEATLADVAQINPRTFSLLGSADALSTHFVPMSAVAEEFGGMDVSTRRALSEVKKGYTSFVEGDVVFAKITPCMENGKGAVVPALSDHLAFGSTEFHVLRAQGGVLPSWLGHYISQTEFRRIARQHMTGSAGQLRVPTSWLERAKIPVPPRLEQSRIVEKLEELLSDLDAGVAELKAAQRKLALYRQSLLKAAVEGSLTAEWRKHNKPAETGAQLLERILVERRKRWEAKQLAKFEEQGKAPSKDWQKKYPEPEDPDTADLPSLPEEWTWISLDQLFESLRSGCAQTSRRTHTSVPILKSSAIRPNSIDFSAQNYLTDEQCKSENWLELGDVLITRLSGSVEYVGCAAVVTHLPAGGMQYPDRIFCGKLVSIAVGLARLVVHCIGSPFLRTRIERAAKSTAGHKRISLSDLASLPIPLPPSTEIDAVADSLDLNLARAAELLNYIALVQSQLNVQRQNLLKAAFSGQLVPQDPNDEPASELLARIRAEREARQPLSKSRRARKETA